MTRKDFVLIAQALKQARPEEGTDKWTQWVRCVAEIGQALKIANVRFEDNKFYAYCRSEY